MIYDVLKLNEQESSMTNRVSARVSLNTLFQEADEIIKLRLDALMETVKSQKCWLGSNLHKI